ncbi:TetR family transcriptional regulator [uncultured Succinatimonas sp.]|uniref:TetR family transcriptional regulator n=1 Tax=uncultured Succinatimonas sp. TaxID=1262973 RepID=UPI0025FEC518|nr:TetR family transcriptional regulator [uncultured Succinatimonas sp.]
MPKRTHEEALQTKKQIMDAAVTLFSSKGYEKTSLSDVARAAGVTRGAIYWHFENKGELLIELLQAIAKDKNLVEPLLDSAKESEFDPLGCIRKWLYAHGTEANLLFVSEIAKIGLSALLEIIGEEELHYRMHELVRNRVYYLKEGIKNAIRRRQLPADVDVELAAEAINLMLVGYVLAVRKDKAFWTLNRYYRLVDACLISLVSIKRDMNSY